MTFFWPWSLWGLVAVAGAAAWALFRPGRELAVVASLSLWREALDGLDRSRRLRSRRLTASWVLLLAGAAAAVAAMGRPVARSAAPARSVAMALYPSAELAGPEGLDGLRRAAGLLLDRLDDSDRVQMLLPGQAARWTSPAQARAVVGELTGWPVAARELPLPSPSGAAQHLYCLAPAGAGVHEGFLAPRGEPGASGQPAFSLIELPQDLPPATVESFAAAILPDGNAEVLVAVRNHTPLPWQGQVRVGTWSPRDGAAEAFARAVRAEPAGRAQVLGACPAGEAIVAEVVATGPNGPRTLHAVQAARREAARVRLAIVGADEPLVRRFVRVCPELELVGRAEEANVLVASGVDPPPGRPALVIRPPGPPAGCRSAGPAEGILMGQAGTAAAEDPIMRGVDLAGLAVRRAEPWTVDPRAPLRVLCRHGQAALIARTAPPEGPLDPQTAGSRRVYLAFALDTENTNFSLSESFVVFLANTFRWLAGGAGGPSQYVRLTPLQAGPHTGWRLVLRRDGWPAGQGGAYPPPGLYLDEASGGAVQAVSLLGPGGAAPQVDVAQAVARAPLPPKAPTGVSRELWPWLALAAVGLWLAGWASRLR